MIFWKYKLFTEIKLPHSKHKCFTWYLSSSYWFTFVFWSFFKVEFKQQWNLSNNQSSYKFSYSNQNYLLDHRYKNNYHIQLFIFFICLFFHFDFKDVIKYTAILSKILHFLWKLFFPWSDTRPTQVVDMDPWPVTWPILSDLIGWGQKISSTSW